MSLIAIILIIISAFMHAGWNLLSKSKLPTASFFLISSLTGATLTSPILIINSDIVINHIPMEVWKLFFYTGFFMTLYYVSLAGAYRSGELSIVYPLARSSPAIVVSVVGLVLGKGNEITILCTIGIFFIVGGCFLIPVKKLNEMKFRNYINATCGLALLAAIGTTGYSIIDDISLKLLRENKNIGINNIQITLIYSCLQSTTAFLFLLIFVGVRKQGRKNLKDLINGNLRHAIYAGIAIHLTYILVLISFAYVKNVSYVVGFRQLSIPLGVTFGILILKEPSYKPKIIGVAIVFVGLILVALG